jgi:dipeptidase E
LTGGGRKVAVIANATDFKDPQDRHGSVEREFNDLRSIGLEPEEVDLRQYFTNNTGLREKLESFDLIWVRGGNVFLLLKAMKQSGAGIIISELLANDTAAYAGYSAGACVLMQDIHGIELVDEPEVLADGYQEAVIWQGLDILPYSFVPHYRSDHPESDAINSVVEYMIENHKPFICLRDGEAIIINSSEQRVAG